jgi:hypothetical protein
VEEMQAFFRELTESKEAELSDTELDQVAGGKGTFGALTSIATLGIGCGIISAVAEAMKDGCGNILSKDINLV